MRSRKKNSWLMWCGSVLIALSLHIAAMQAYATDPVPPQPVHMEPGMVVIRDGVINLEVFVDGHAAIYWFYDGLEGKHRVLQASAGGLPTGPRTWGGFLGTNDDTGEFNKYIGSLSIAQDNSPLGIAIRDAIVYSALFHVGGKYSISTNSVGNIAFQTPDVSTRMRCDGYTRIVYESAGYNVFSQFTTPFRMYIDSDSWMRDRPSHQPSASSHFEDTEKNELTILFNEPMSKYTLSDEGASLSPFSAQGSVSGQLAAEVSGYIYPSRNGGEIVDFLYWYDPNYSNWIQTYDENVSPLLGPRWPCVYMPAGWNILPSGDYKWANRHDVQGVRVQIVDPVVDGETITVTLDRKARDLGGNHLDREYTFSWVVTNPLQLQLDTSTIGVTQGNAVEVAGTVRLNGAVMPNAAVRLIDDAGVLVQDTTNSSGRFLLQYTEGRPQGSYQFNVVATTSQGNSASSQLTVNVFNPAQGQDLRAFFVTADSRKKPGQNITGTVQVQNVGSKAVGGQLTVKLYRSNGQLHAEIPTRNIPTLAPSGTRSETFTLPGLNGEDTLQLIACVITTGGDENPANNCESRSVIIANDQDINGYVFSPQYTLTPSSNRASWQGYHVDWRLAHTSSPRFDVFRGNTSLCTNCIIRPGEVRIFDGGSLAVTVDWVGNVPSWQCGVRLAADGPSPLSAQPGETTVIRGQEARYFLSTTTNDRLDEVDVLGGVGDGDSINNYYIQRPGNNIWLNVRTNSLSPGDYAFWVQVWGRDNNYLQRLYLTVLPAPDLALSVPTPSAGSQRTIGDLVNFGATLSRSGSGTVQATVTGSVTGPGGYQFAFTPIQVPVSSPAQVTFPWDTTGRQPGQYTFTATGQIAGDSNPANNTVSTTVVLVEPALGIQPIDLPSSQPEGSVLLIRALVSASGSPESGAVVTAEVAPPGGTAFEQLLSYQPDLSTPTEAVYQSAIFLDKVGTYTIGYRATKSGHQQATASRTVVCTNVAPIVYMNETTAPNGGETSLPNQVFNWTGFDPITPPDDLEYSWRFDGGPWSEWSSMRSAEVSTPEPGEFVFEVKARDLYEAESEPLVWTFFVVQPCPGDANGDGVVDFDDFAILAFQFGQCGENLSADFNGDGCVDFEDFSILAFNFNTICP